jgi:hypothetical protein
MLSSLFCLALVSAPPTAAPAASASQPKEVIEDEWIAIPAPLEEVVTTQTEPEDVWVPGYWERDPGKWTWKKGHWETPPEEAAHWRKGHWAWQDGEWHWRKGHWAVEDVTWLVSAPLAIPDPLPEERPAKPDKDNHWVAGHWDWDAGWRWIPGYYTHIPDPKAKWVAGRWEPYGKDGYWWMGGHWEVE